MLSARGDNICGGQLQSENYARVFHQLGPIAQVSNLARDIIFCRSFQTPPLTLAMAHGPSLPFVMYISPRILADHAVRSDPSSLWV